MKRLLFLMLVLGLASAAKVNAVPAGFSLRVAGPKTPWGIAPPQEAYIDVNKVYLFAGECVWIGVYNSIQGEPGDTRQQNFILGFVEPHPGNSWTGNWTQYKPPLVTDAPANEYYGVQDLGSGLVLDLWYLQLLDGNPEHFQGIGVLDAKELYKQYGPSVNVVALYDENMEFIDSICVYNIPEPTAITLLGLGAVMMRKRKK
jgi:hypothetical protein